MSREHIKHIEGEPENFHIRIIEFRDHTYKVEYKFYDNDIWKGLLYCFIDYKPSWRLLIIEDKKTLNIYKNMTKQKFILYMKKQRDKYKEYPKLVYER